MDPIFFLLLIVFLNVMPDPIASFNLTLPSALRKTTLFLSSVLCLKRHNLPASPAFHSPSTNTYNFDRHSKIISSSVFSTRATSSGFSIGNPSDSADSSGLVVEGVKEGTAGFPKLNSGLDEDDAALPKLNSGGALDEDAGFPKLNFIDFALVLF